MSLEGKTIFVTGLPLLLARRSKVSWSIIPQNIQSFLDVTPTVRRVSGSTDGIGKHTAERLAKDGATVLVHGR